MDDFMDGCYCPQAQDCQHWITSRMDVRIHSVKEWTHSRAATSELERQEEDHRPIVTDLQRELRVAMQEIEKLAQVSRDLAKTNQDLEESRLLAISDQARTAKRLLVTSSQLDYTEQKLYKLTKEMDDGQKDSDLLRIERIKREALQEREDAGRLRIEALEDELQEVQRSERLLHQKYITTQSKYETLSKRHDNLKRHQQELELARESKEALAWLKETTDRLCSPPQGSLGQAIQQDQHSINGSAPISIHQRSPSVSPTYPSSLIDPPLAAQNQLISLIKELATTNSTLRSELNEYRELLQDTRNDMLSLQSQLEDYEQGYICEGCSAQQDDQSGSFLTSKSAWSGLDATLAAGLDAVSQIGTLGTSMPGSPPPYMTTPVAAAAQVQSSSSHHVHQHQHFHLPGVRGNVFGELERLYSQGVVPPTLVKQSRDHRRMRRSSRLSTTSSKYGISPPTSINPPMAMPVSETGMVVAKTVSTKLVSTSTSTSEARRAKSPPMVPVTTSDKSSFQKGTSTNLRDTIPVSNPFAASSISPHQPRSKKQKSKKKKALYTDIDLDMLGSDDEPSDEKPGSAEDDGSLSDESEDEYEGPGFVSAFAEALSFLTFFTGPMSGSSP